MVLFVDRFDAHFLFNTTGKAGSVPESESPTDHLTLIKCGQDKTLKTVR